MFSKCVRGAILLCIGSSLLFASPVFASSASISLSASRVRAGYGVTVHGSHFRPSAYVAIMFAYPKLGRHAFERFVGKAYTNGSGAFTQQVQIPRIGQCGRAHLYGQVVGTTDFIGESITLTGCKGTKRPPSKP